MDDLLDVNWSTIAQDVAGFLGAESHPTEMTTLLEAEVTTGVTVSNISTSDRPFLEEIGLTIGKFAFPTLTGVGLVANILTLVVMHRSYMLKRSSSVFFSALAVADMFLLLQTFWFNWMSTYTKVTGSSEVIWLTPEGCKYYLCLQFFSASWSAWLTMAMTAERLVVTTFPLKAKMWCTRRRACVTVVLITVILALIWVLALFTRSKTPTALCQNYSSTLAPLITTIYIVLPVCSLFIMNGFIIYQVTKAKKKSMKMMAAQQLNDLTKRTLKITRTALMVSTAYLVLVTPSFVVLFMVASGWFSQVPGLIRLVNNITTTLRMCNHASNFFFYLIFIPKVRSEVRTVFCRVCTPK